MSQTSAFSFFGNADQLRPDGKSTTFGRFNLQTLLDFSNLQPRVQTHLKNVYTCLLVTTLCATLGVYLSMAGWLNYPRLAIFASIITSVWLFAIDFNARTQMKCFALMSATALFTGIYLSPLINLAIDIDPQIVVTAFLLTTTIFVCFTLSALLTQKRTYLYLGGLLGTGTSIMLLLSLMNIFGRSQLIFNVNLYFGLLIACGYILYDTQLIVERAIQGDMNYVKHAILLFIDMVDLFVRILIILLKNSQNKNKKNSNR
jgi:FtsH-binding integral membrane protein